MISLFKNKKGSSLSGWTEAGVGIIVFLLCLGIIVVGLNVEYSKNYDSTFGITSNSTQASLEDYQQTLETGLEGEAETNAINGINIVSSWGVIRSGLYLVMDMVTGGWIQNAISLLNWGSAGDFLGWGLRLLFIFSIAFIFIKILFKVKP